DQPDRRLPSCCLADSGVLLALQGAVRHHRNAARAVLRLDQGSVGARPDQPFHAVRPFALRPDAAADVRTLSRAWGVADHHGHHDVVPVQAQPDPTQQMIFSWMPLIFTFMLAGFPAGLVIYWAWNNTLSVLQQSLIMRRNGVKVELFDNLKSTFFSKKAESKT